MIITEALVPLSDNQPSQRDIYALPSFLGTEAKRRKKNNQPNKKTPHIMTAEAIPGTEMHHRWKKEWWDVFINVNWLYAAVYQRMPWNTHKQMGYTVDSSSVTLKKYYKDQLLNTNQSYHLDQTEHHLNFTEFTADQVQPLIITIYAFFRWMLPAA